jgi:hypothetical protein
MSKNLGIYAKWYLDNITPRMKKKCDACEKIPRGKFRLVRETPGGRFTIMKVYCSGCALKELYGLEEIIKALANAMHESEPFVQR